MQVDEHLRVPAQDQCCERVDADPERGDQGAGNDEAEQLAQGIARLPNVHLAGITTYPGHIWTAPDEQGGSLSRRPLVASTVGLVVLSGIAVLLLGALSGMLLVIGELMGGANGLLLAF